MMPAEQMAVDTDVNFRELLGRVEGDRELLCDIFEIFNNEFPKSYESLTSALACNDLKQIQTSAHTLKGMLASLSFVRASATAMRIEQMARLSQCEGIAEEITSLGVTAHAAQVSLHQVCTEDTW
jgi:two-component system, sensor histidine kinase and response regulator